MLLELSYNYSYNYIIVIIEHPTGLLLLPCFLPSPFLYRRSGFDCEILLIANCEFFHNSQSKESQEKDYSINNILPAWQFVIIKIAI